MVGGMHLPPKYVDFILQVRDILSPIYAWLLGLRSVPALAMPLVDEGP
jgi:hypothetical protein